MEVLASYGSYIVMCICQPHRPSSPCFLEHFLLKTCKFFLCPFQVCVNISRSKSWVSQLRKVFFEDLGATSSRWDTRIERALAPAIEREVFIFLGIKPVNQCKRSPQLPGGFRTNYAWPMLLSNPAFVRL